MEVQGGKDDSRDENRVRPLASLIVGNHEREHGTGGLEQMWPLVSVSLAEPV